MMKGKIRSDLPKILIYFYLFFTLLILYIGTLPLYSDYTKTDPKKPTDFIAFIVGASIVRDGKVKEIYNPSLQRIYQDVVTSPNKIGWVVYFRLLPLAAYLYVPLVYLKPVAAFYTWAGLNIILLFLSIWFVKKSFKLDPNVFWLYTATIFTFLPFRDVVNGGQLSGILLLVFCISIYLAKRSRYFLAGAFLGLLLLKANLLAIVPFFFIVQYLQNSRSIKGLCLGFLLSSSIIVGANVLIYGPNLLTDYPRYLFLIESLGGIPLLRNSNPVSIISLLTKNRFYLFGGSAIISLVIAGLFLSLFRKTKNYDVLYAMVPALGLFLNFHTMFVDLTLLLPSLYILGNYYFINAKNTSMGFLKCLGVMLVFFIPMLIGAYELEIIAWPIMLLFFYLTLKTLQKEVYIKK